MNEKELLGKYKLVLGLEIHLHPKTEYKMFCGCDADIWQKEPNTQTCPTCLGLPGALPVPNLDAVKKTQLLGLALNCKLNKNSRFDRKHYFYPDLPKGYQISQYKQPLCGEGSLKLESGSIVEIERIHLEEDVAKSFHRNGKTCLDFNKSGLPLIELVTKPTFRNTQDAVEFSKKLQNIVRKLGIGEVDMEKGQMRLEANISLRTKEMEDLNELPKYKVEVKNINSFRFVQKAVEYEIERQKKLLESGQKVIQETRGWSESKNATVSQRTKEVAKDYRYFPEPDIPPVRLRDEEMKILRAKTPELPEKKMARFRKEYGLSEYDSRILCENKWLAQYYEEAISQMNKIQIINKQINKQISNKQIANLIINKKVDVSKKNPGQLVTLIISSQKKSTISDEELKEIVEKIIKDNPKAVNDYKNGKQVALMFLVGCAMRETKGQTEVGKVQEILKEFLSNI